MDFSQFEMNRYSMKEFENKKSQGHSQINWDFPFVVLFEDRDVMEQAEVLKATLTKFTAQFPLTEQAKNMVQGKPNNRAQAPVLLASGLNEANSITGSLLPDNCAAVSHVIKGCNEVWLFGMKDPCVYIDAEPNFLAQMRIFHSGTVCAIAAHASEAARVLHGKYGPGLALQQAQAYIGD